MSLLDNHTLVKDGHELVRLLEIEGIGVRAALWVHSNDTSIWQLWIVPQHDFKDKRQFYHKISLILSKNREVFSNIDAADVEMVAETHPALPALSKFIRIEGFDSAHISNNIFNEFFIPDGIILRIAL